MRFGASALNTPDSIDRAPHTPTAAPCSLSIPLTGVVSFTMHQHTRSYAEPVARQLDRDHRFASGMGPHRGFGQVWRRNNSGSAWLSSSGSGMRQPRLPATTIDAAARRRRSTPGSSWTSGQLQSDHGVLGPFRGTPCCSSGRSHACKGV